MGKTLNRDQRKNHKYMTRETGRKLKEQQQYANLSDEPRKEKPKPKWRPRSEMDDE